MKDSEDEAFDEIERRQNKSLIQPATPFTVTDSYARNNVLEEVAAEFDKMKVFGDTAASFAAFVRGMKR